MKWKNNHKSLQGQVAEAIQRTTQRIHAISRMPSNDSAVYEEVVRLLDQRAGLASLPATPIVLNSLMTLEDIMQDLHAGSPALLTYLRFMHDWLLSLHTDQPRTSAFLKTEDHRRFRMQVQWLEQRAVSSLEEPVGIPDRIVLHLEESPDPNESLVAPQGHWLVVECTSKRVLLHPGQTMQTDECPITRWTSIDATEIIDHWSIHGPDSIEVSITWQIVHPELFWHELVANGILTSKQVVQHHLAPHIERGISMSGPLSHLQDREDTLLDQLRFHWMATLGLEILSIQLVHS